MVRLYKENPGLFYIINPEQARFNNRKYNIKCLVYSPKISAELYHAKEKYFYFDEFCYNRFISYSDIIQLDRPDRIIVIRGTPRYGLHPTYEFIQYMNDNYPESMI